MDPTQLTDVFVMVLEGLGFPLPSAVRGRDGRHPRRPVSGTSRAACGLPPRAAVCKQNQARGGSSAGRAVASSYSTRRALSKQSWSAR